MMWHSASIAWLKLMTPSGKVARQALLLLRRNLRLRRDHIYPVVFLAVYHAGAPLLRVSPYTRFC